MKKLVKIIISLFIIISFSSLTLAAEIDTPEDPYDPAPGSGAWNPAQTTYSSSPVPSQLLPDASPWSPMSHRTTGCSAPDPACDARQRSRLPHHRTDFCLRIVGSLNFYRYNALVFLFTVSIAPVIRHPSIPH